jgi:hypothetical protein
MRYADRKKNEDGTFANEEDHAAEERVKAALEAAWKVTLVKRPGRYEPIDFDILYDGVKVGVVEVKHRTQSMKDFGVVWFNHRKRRAMQKVVDEGLTAIFAVEFTDGIVWIDYNDIDLTRTVIGGCRDYVKGSLDREELIEIPLEEMRSLEAVRRE